MEKIDPQVVAIHDKAYRTWVELEGLAGDLLLNKQYLSNSGVKITNKDIKQMVDTISIIENIMARLQKIDM